MVATSVYNFNSAADLKTVDSWLGKDVDSIMLTAGSKDWNDWLGSMNWEAGLFKGQSVGIHWSIPLVPYGANLADAAAGKYADKYLAMAKQLAADPGPDGKVYVRLGWEFNGNGWNSSSAVGQPQNYAEAYRQFVDTCRTVSDKFVFEWCPNVGATDMNPELAYPGDKYVDVIGTDFYYNTAWDSKDAKTAFNWFVKEPYGLQWQQDFAAAHGKQTAIGEWGINSDSPEFIQLASKWFSDHNMLYQNYWDSNADFQGKLSSGQYPNAEAAYKAIYGSTDTAGHTSSAPASSAPVATVPVTAVAASTDTTLGDGALSLTLTGTANVAGTGNALDNVITGNAGNNVLHGMAGNDTINGGGGNDTLYGDQGNDILNAGDGNDILNGGIGADTMTGGSGNDTYYVDDAGDKVIEAANGGSDVVYASIGYTLAANVEQLVLTGSADINATGNALDNVITGNGGKNIIDGGAGADTMSGGDGNDTYYVDNAGDRVIEGSGPAGGLDSVYASVSYTLGTNVENLTLTGAADLQGTGNGLDNMIVGNAGNSVLHGMAGNDTIYGGAGNDQLYGDQGDDKLYGGAGNDLLVGSTGADMMAGGAGDDTYYVENVGDRVVELPGEGVDQVYSTIDYTLSDNVENLFLSGTANIAGTGNALDNRILGNSGDNVLTGMDGNDRLQGDDGNDTLHGGAGNDMLYGNNGNDTLDGGTGADIMEGGAGNDIYYVDNAGDQVTEYYYSGGGGVDTVYSSIDYTLGANVENLTLTGTANLRATGNSLDNVIHGNDGDNIINGGTGNDILWGGKGADTFVVQLWSGTKTVADFGTGDSLDLSAWMTAHKTASLATSGGNTIISYDGKAQITLLGVTADHLHATANGFTFG